MTLTVLIADDEPPARQRLRRLLGEAGITEVREAKDGLEALKLTQSERFDVVFLDIDMPLLDGLGVARALGGEGPSVIFVTAYDEHALAAFELAATDYLVKPVRPSRLQQAIARARTAVDGRSSRMATLFETLDKTRAPTRVAVKSGADFQVVDTGEIQAITAEDHYAVIRSEAGEILSDETLDQLSTRLPEGQFLRIHRSTIINVAHLKRIEREGDRKYVAVMVAADAQRPPRFPIARDRLPSVKAALGIA